MTKIDNRNSLKGMIFDIQRYSINDGPGIRTTVFFKDCPMACFWCSNPESQKLYPQLLYFDSLCSRCYRCKEVCPEGATAIEADGSIRIDRGLCKSCGACVDVCVSEARFISGKLMTVDEILDIVKKDDLFYRNSGGGVTASGGEPTYQPEFLRQFLKECQLIGLHTTLDTCGYVHWEVLEKILEHVDLVLYDIKHMDPAKHLALTGVDNELILENIERIIRKEKATIMRMPLIPEQNDSEESIEAVAKFLVRIGARRLDLVPYHQLGTKKYERLGMEYKLDEINPYKEEEVNKIIRDFEAYGLDVTIA